MLTATIDDNPAGTMRTIRVAKDGEGVAEIQTDLHRNGSRWVPRCWVQRLDTIDKAETVHDTSRLGFMHRGEAVIHRLDLLDRARKQLEADYEDQFERGSVVDWI